MTSIFDKLSEQDKYTIAYRYLVEEKQFREIYEPYRHLGTFTRFHRAIAKHLFNDKRLMLRVLKAKMPEKEYEEKFYVIPDTTLGSKRESYWNKEEDAIFQNATYGSLSPQEKKIFRVIDNFYKKQFQSGNVAWR